ncbi:hypothetical protein QWY84_07120 [Aquisalimonas lutea]|uniref:hypothetical protein n=1 Tax=Aquisalimonas lutea TaxID=1327750 RepID=UPI0025B412B7|nr:hypothetical protein [Aquisalimonas lutea]MDN3517373.1 hypothetical protein [Aquisalimonas lutea]
MEVTPGVLLHVHGVGLLLTGDSGSGKSDGALALLERGHQLVADDVVEVSRTGDRLRGRAPARLKGLLEVRGVGICPVASLFGPKALRADTVVDLAVTLETDVDWTNWPRLAPLHDTVPMAGVAVPRVRLPVSPARPVALLLEVIARRHAAGTLSQEASHE